MRRASGPSTQRWQACWTRLLRWKRGQGRERIHSPRGLPPYALQLQSRQLWLRGHLGPAAGTMPGAMLLATLLDQAGCLSAPLRMHCSVAEALSPAYSSQARYQSC